MTANDNVLTFSNYAAERDYQDAVDKAQIAAGWFFNRATVNAKAEFDATMDTLRGTVGPRWNRAREAAHKKFAEDTKEANALFEETVEWFLSHGEISESLDDRWTELFQREAVQHQIAAE